MAFIKAEKSKAKLRMAIFGTAGSGKTFTALRVASGIAKALNSRIAVIDTERGSASKYADRFDFDTLELTPAKIENYTSAFADAEKAGYKVLVIDSMSHGWQELLEEIEALAKQRYNGNTFRAWGEGTPKQREFIDAMLAFNGHIIATMRAKTDYIISDDGKGKMKPQRVGLAPEQGKGIEYEFDLLAEINAEHYATIIKDRTGKYQDKGIDKPGEEFGAELVAWLNSGAEIIEKPKAEEEPKKPEPQKAEQPKTQETGKVAFKDKPVAFRLSWAIKKSAELGIKINMADLEILPKEEQYQTIVKAFNDKKKADEEKRIADLQKKEEPKEPINQPF
jgi:hypothetical protein